MLVVCDTSPIRALQTLHRVDLIKALFGGAIMPPAVAAELAIDAPEVGVFSVSDYPFLAVRTPADVRQVEALRRELGPGESEALVLAAEIRANYVLIDESIGRRVAARMGLEALGVLALLVEAKTKGLVESVAPLMHELEVRINFRVSTEVRRIILRDAGEET